MLPSLTFSIFDPLGCHRGRPPRLSRGQFPGGAALHVLEGRTPHPRSHPLPADHGKPQRRDQRRRRGRRHWHAHQIW